jgi:hypothetical protein
MAFAQAWHARACVCGWSPLTLYGLCLRAPHARLDRFGAAWLIATSASRLHVVAVDASAIEVTSTTGAPLRIYRPAREQEAVLPWTVAAAR